MRKDEVIFAEHNGELFIKTKAAGIHPLVLCCDGLPLCMFGKSKTPYIKVKDAIVWHEKELAQTRGASGCKTTLEALKSALDKFNRGEWHDSNKQANQLRRNPNGHGNIIHRTAG